MAQALFSGRSAMAVAAASLGLTTAIALAISASFPPPVFLSWVALAAMAGVPAQIVIGGIWRHEHPAFLGRLPQPLKGLAYMALTALAAGLVTLSLAFGVGDGAAPSPVLVMYVVLSISVAFWWIVGFGAWPLRPSALSGLASLPAIYAATLVLYVAFFDFRFLPGQPLPHGLFDAWDALILAVTSVALLLAATLFEARGPLVSAAILAAASATLRLGPLRLDYLVYGPVSFIFGYFIVQTLMQGQAFRALARPARGMALTLGAALAGAAMTQLYRLAAPLPPGPDQDLWIATAMLAVTFPLISAFSGSLEFWPLIRRPRAASPSPDGS